MKIPSIALGLLIGINCCDTVSSLSLHNNKANTAAFISTTPSSSLSPSSCRSQSIPRKTTQLSMSVSPIEEQASKGRSREEIEAEVSSGQILEDGPVIDFGSVKDSTSTAEQALLKAREEYLKTGKVDLALPTTAIPNRLMGINDEVVKEVGREVGSFMTDDDTIQKCAAYLRSKATTDLFLPNEQAPSLSDMTHIDIPESDLDSLLAQSYEESGVVTEAFAKTFYMGTQLLPPEAQKAIWAVYVWCRRTDEIVDAPRDPDDVDMLTDLSAWEIRLENLFQYGVVEDVLDLALLDCKIKYPKLPIEPFVDMIRGMLMDLPDLGQERYESFEELHLYCYRVAGTVGLMCMPVFGCEAGFTEEDAKEPALSLGVAFQITNILRDIGEDAKDRGRIYLPREDMAKFGVTEEQIYARKLDDNYIALMKYEIDRARMYYERAKRGVPMLSAPSRLPVQSSLDCYGKILDKIEENGYDSLNNRAYVSKWEKLAEIPLSWYRTQELSKILPLPGDESK